MLRFIHDPLKDKILCKNGGKGGTLMIVPDCCKNQKMCRNPVDNYVHAF